MIYRKPVSFAKTLQTVIKKLVKHRHSQNQLIDIDSSNINIFLYKIINKY